MFVFAHIYIYKHKCNGRRRCTHKESMYICMPAMHMYMALVFSTRLIPCKSWDVVTRHPAYQEYGTGDQNQRAHSTKDWHRRQSQRAHFGNDIARLRELGFSHVLPGPNSHDLHSHNSMSTLTQSSTHPQVADQRSMRRPPAHTTRPSEQDV